MTAKIKSLCFPVCYTGRSSERPEWKPLLQAVCLPNHIGFPTAPRPTPGHKATCTSGAINTLPSIIRSSEEQRAQWSRTPAPLADSAWQSTHFHSVFSPGLPAEKPTPSNARIRGQRPCSTTVRQRGQSIQICFSPVLPHTSTLERNPSPEDPRQRCKIGRTHQRIERVTLQKVSIDQISFLSVCGLN